jgi:hypothetical protein
LDFSITHEGDEFMDKNEQNQNKSKTEKPLPKTKQEPHPKTDKDIGSNSEFPSAL